METLKSFVKSLRDEVAGIFKEKMSFWREKIQNSVIKRVNVREAARNLATVFSAKIRKQKIMKF